MADIRIKDLPTTATQTASDDFIALDGTVNGTRKIDASAPSFKTSVTSPSIVAPAATALTLTGGSTGASLVLGQGTTAGDLTFTPTGSATAGTFLLSRRTPNGATLGTISYGADSTSLNQGTGYFHLVTNSAIPLLLGTNTAERARFTTTGNLLIGTTGDAGDRLRVVTSTTTAGAGAIYTTKTGAVSGTSYGTYTEVSGASTTNVAGYFTAAGATTNRAVEIGSGIFKSSDTTAASSTTTGALQVGSNVGLSGNAGGASYFGGDITGTSSSNITGGRFTSINSNSYIEQNGTDFLYATASTRPHVFSIGGTVRATIATTGLNLTGTTSASSSTVGALTIGNGTAATNVAIGGGNINAGGTLTAASGAITKTASANEAQISFTNDNRTGYFGIGGSTNAATILRDKFYLYGLGGTVIATWDGSGNQVLTGTTASTGVGTGALQVAGGIYAGAASVFGGQLTISSAAPYQLLTATAGTNYAYTEYVNTGNNLRIGLENSSGASIVPGAPAYSAFVASVGARSLVFATNNLVRQTIDSAGAATFAGAVAVAGATVSTSTGIITPAATTAISSVRLPHGTAPTSPVNGDMWTTTAGLYVRINGVTVGPLS